MAKIVTQRRKRQSASLVSRPTLSDGMYSLSKEEQEFSISGTRADDGFDVYASDRTYITKLDKLCKECPEYYKCIHADQYGKTYRIKDKSLVSFRKGKMKRELTDEQRQAASDRMHKIVKGK